MRDDIDRFSVIELITDGKSLVEDSCVVSQENNIREKAIYQSVCVIFMTNMIKINLKNFHKIS